MAPLLRCLRHEDYTVAWISALPLELAEAIRALDEEHHGLPQHALDSNVYTLGSIGGLNVVMACLPAGQTGTNAAATVTTQMRSQFTSIRYCLLVGIGGGVPSPQSDVRLGDVVVSQPHLDRGGVVQYDFGKSTPNGFERTGFLNAPPEILLSALSKIQATNVGPGSLSSHPLLLGASTILPDRPTSDLLFNASYDHTGGASCDSCDTTQLVKRPERSNHYVHYGTIASGNQVIKAGVVRDQLSAKLGGVLCFEMEAAGIMRNLPCLVIRGICDYADSHKTKLWQPYSSAVAAAYAKKLLLVMPDSYVGEQADLDVTKRGLQRFLNYSHRPKSSDLSLVEEGFFNMTDHISDYEPDRTHWEYVRKKCPGTTSWILKDHRLKSWFERKSSSCLWLTGKIGSGKTLLTSTILEHIAQESHQNHQAAVHFFYSHSRRWLLLASDLFRSYIKQILGHLDKNGIARPAQLSSSLRRFFGSKASSPSFDEMIEIVFFPLCDLVPGSTYVVNGLNECGGEEALRVLKVLRKLAVKHDTRILISGRENLDIKHVIPRTAAIHISEEDIKEDIQDFVEWKISEKTQERQLTEKTAVLEDIKRTLINKADRMILWVSLQIDCIWQECFTDAEIHEALENLPKDLDETYARCLERGENYRDRFASKVLRWVYAAIRPFTMNQLREALAVDIHSGHLDHSRVPTTQDVLRSCANLVVQELNGSIVFAHHSIRQFLEGRSSNIELFPAGFNLLDARLELAQLCIAHLSSSDYGMTVQLYTGNKGSTLQLEPTAIVRLTDSIPSLVRYALPKPKAIQVKLPIRESNSAPGTHLPGVFHFARDQWAILTREMHPESCPFWEAFCRLALAPNSSWRMHPWTPLGQSLDSHYLSLLGWASVHQHFPLMEAILGAGGPKLKNDLFRIPLVYYGSLPVLHLVARTGNHAMLMMVISKCDIKLIDPSRRTALHYAAEVGSYPCVRALIQSGAVVEAQDVSGLTPLHLAAQFGHRASAKALLDAGARSSIRSSAASGMKFPVQLAAAHGHEAAVKLLLDSVHKVQIPRNSRNEVLLYAAEYGWSGVVTKLLAEGADVDAANESKERAVEVAAKNGNVETIQILLRSGASYFGGPLFLAATYGVADIVQWAAHGNIDIVHDGMTAVKKAAAKGHALVVRELLSCGAFADLRSLVRIAHRGEKRALPLLVRQGLDESQRDRALLEVVQSGPIDVIPVLIESGININGNGSQLTPLMQSSKLGDKKATELLIKLGADLNIYYKGNTAIDYAVRNGQMSIVRLLAGCGAFPTTRVLISICAVGDDTLAKFLIEAGARLNDRDDLGRTALDIATVMGHVSTVKLLVGCGAVPTAGPLLNAADLGEKRIVHVLLSHGLDTDVSLEGSEGPTALALAARRGHKGTIQLLLDHGAKATLRWHIKHTQPLEQNFLDTIELLLEHGADINVQDAEGYTLLHQSANLRRTETVKFLLEHGASPKVQDSRGRTALHEAVSGDPTRDFFFFEEIIRLLIEYGVDLNVQDIDGRTALHEIFAKKAGLGYPYNLETVVRLLLELGADANLRDTRGCTVLQEMFNKRTDSKAAYNWENVLRLLICHGADINIQDLAGRNALHKAISRCFRTPFSALRNAINSDPFVMAAILIDQGTNLNNQDKSGRTALHELVQVKTTEGRAMQFQLILTKMLLERGALLNIKDRRGITALRIALHEHPVYVPGVDSFSPLAKIIDDHVHGQDDFRPVDTSYECVLGCLSNSPSEVDSMTRLDSESREYGENSKDSNEAPI